MYVWHAYMLWSNLYVCGIAYMLWSNLDASLYVVDVCVWHSLYVVEQPVCMCGIALYVGIAWSNLYVCVACMYVCVA